MLFDCMVRRGNPHTRGFFVEAINESGKPIFTGEKFGCFYYEAKADEPDQVAFVVHSLTGKKAAMDQQCSLSMTTAIQQNNDFTAFFVVGEQAPVLQDVP